MIASINSLPRHAVITRPGEVRAKLVGAVDGDQRRHRRQASVVPKLDMLLTILRGFEGPVNKSGFHIHKVMTWPRDTFIPVAHCSFSVEKKGVNRNVHLMLLPIVKWLALSGYAIMLTVMIASTVGWFRRGIMEDGFPALGLGIIFYILMVVGWPAGVYQVRRFLSTLFAQSEV